MKGSSMRNLKAKLLKLRSKKSHCPYCPNDDQPIHAVDRRIKRLSRRNSPGGFCGSLRWFPEFHLKHK